MIQTGEPVTLKTTRGSTFLWQLTVWINSLAIELETGITILYWMFLGPPESYRGYITHLMPIVLLTVDFILNMTVIELR